MAKTEDGKKIVHVKGYKRVKPGGVKKVREVRTHCRSTPRKPG
jgi:hypothetical protein